MSRSTDPPCTGQDACSPLCLPISCLCALPQLRHMQPANVKLCFAPAPGMAHSMLASCLRLCYCRHQDLERMDVLLRRMPFCAINSHDCAACPLLGHKAVAHSE